MSNEARTIREQINLLRERGMVIDDENEAVFYLGHISYFRLKGYWWDMQIDEENHIFKVRIAFQRGDCAVFFR